ncbi:hypothetical protein N7457_009795 [Penicillium paradoxum]|uniref:uncharacterized protein n=1 Tax=Penicillium paradoxum TaxID=176176 RepID=UPI002547E13B|nr:uncharacterized protein N7457_009795 [Penicillium paradoxum]KAJ5774899.1 hypothetical protein N7457_009795 [Penicillium paradoxum]
MSSQDTPPVKRRESRSGTRKVSTLSAEQLERKRANDREAQRSIRQRTKDRIEQLETQVSALQAQNAEMRLQTDRIEEVMQHNAFLENEVRRLKTQIASLTGRPEFASTSESIAPFRAVWPVEEASHNPSSGIPTTGALLPPHFAATSDPRRPAATLSSSRRASRQQDWQQSYPSTRSASLGAASDPEYPSRIESYMIDGHLHQGHRIGQPAPQISFSGTSSPHQQQSEASFPQFPYSNRPLSISSASPVSQPPSDRVYQSSTSAYSQSQHRDHTYEYPWAPPS